MYFFGFIIILVMIHVLEIKVDVIMIILLILGILSGVELEAYGGWGFVMIKLASVK